MSIVVFKDRTVLPYQYQEIEYLEGSGTQRIVLNFGFDPNAEIEFRSARLDNTRDTYLIAPSSWNTSGSNRFAMGGQYNNRGVAFGNVLTSQTVYSPIIVPDFTLKMPLTEKYKNRVFTCGDSSVNVSNITFNTTTYNLVLFYGYNRVNAGRIYHFNYKLNDFECNLIPCYRKADNVSGMYDTVNDVFYTNAGTGAFINGPVKSLPSEYQQVEYIESTGTQYIDLGIPFSYNDNVSITFSMAELSTGTIFGNVSTIANVMRLLYYNNCLNFQCGAQSGLKEIYNPLQDEVLDVEIASQHISVNSSVQSLIIADTPQDQNACLFAVYNASGTVMSFSKIKLYSLSMYDASENLTMYLMPCYRRADGVIGLYDAINDVFYTNAGTGNFVKPSNPGFEVAECKVCLLKQNTNAQNLPYEYQEVEYIEGSGTQYIDIGFDGSNNATFVLDMQLNNTTADEQLMGKSWYSNGGFAIGYAKNASASQFLAQIGHSLIPNGTLDTNRHKLSLTIANGSSVTFDADGVKAYDTVTYSTSSQSMSLFARKNYINNRVSVNEYVSGKLYSCQVYDNNVLIRNLIPCYRRTDNVVGMYDKVNDTFYTNNGSGSFSKGNEIHNFEVEECEIVLFNQTQQGYEIINI